MSILLFFSKNKFRFLFPSKPFTLHNNTNTSKPLKATPLKYDNLRDTAQNNSPDQAFIFPKIIARLD